ncbi:WG repeat-containing protein, partial [Cutibacterium acnes]
MADGLYMSPSNLFRVYMYSEGLTRYENEQGHWMFLDRQGRETLRADYDTVLNFREGRAAVSKNGKWGFINREGKEVIPLRYDEIRDDDGYGMHAGTSGFYEGLSAVSKNGKWGFIDQSGKEVIPLTYDWANNFHEGLAVVSKNGKWGYVNQDGDEVIPLVYDDALHFSEGLGSVLRLNDSGHGFHWMFVDRSGKIVTDFKNKYEMVYPYHEGVAIA